MRPISSWRHARQIIQLTEQEHRMTQPDIAPLAIAYDAVILGNIPSNARIVLFYMDGRYAATEAELERFTEAEAIVPITVTGDIRGVIGDVENGDLTPAGARQWIEERQANGLICCTPYTSRDNWPALISACRGKAYYPFIADWTDSPHPLGDAVMVQYSNNGNRFDTSAVYSQTWLDAAIEAARIYWS